MLRSETPAEAPAYTHWARINFVSFEFMNIAASTVPSCHLFNATDSEVKIELCERNQSQNLEIIFLFVSPYLQIDNSTVAFKIDHHKLQSMNHFIPGLVCMRM